jgi:hypothetical protein
VIIFCKALLRFEEVDASANNSKKLINILCRVVKMYQTCKKEGSEVGSALQNDFIFPGILMR